MMKPISLASLPHERWAFDLDGVLAVKPPLSAKSWMRMNGPERTAFRAATLGWYEVAAPQGHIEGAAMPACIISARKETPEIRAVTQAWLNDAGLSSIPLHLLNVGRTIENVAKFKVDVLKENCVDAFVEDNKAVLKAMARLQPTTHLYFWDKDSPAVPELFYTPCSLL